MGSRGRGRWRARSAGCRRDRARRLPRTRRAQNQFRRSGEPPVFRIERDAIERRAFLSGFKHQTASVTRQAERHTGARGRGDGFGRTGRLPGGRIDGHAPEIERAASAAAEVQVPPVSRPHRVPVDVRVVCDVYGLTAVDRDGPEVPRCAAAHAAAQAPEGNALAVRRPCRLHRVLRSQLAAGSARQVDHRDHAVNPAGQGIDERLGGNGQALPVRRPGRIVTGVGDLAARFARRAHHE